MVDRTWMMNRIILPTRPSHEKEPFSVATRSMWVAAVFKASAAICDADVVPCKEAMLSRP